MKTPHYLRFVQALVLAASVPACAADADPTAPTTDPAAESTAAVTPAPDPSSEPEKEVAVADAGDPEGVDAGLPFFSGPIVPPELPARLA